MVDCVAVRGELLGVTDGVRVALFVTVGVVLGVVVCDALDVGLALSETDLVCDSDSDGVDDGVHAVLYATSCTAPKAASAKLSGTQSTPSSLVSACTARPVPSQGAVLEKLDPETHSTGAPGTSAIVKDVPHGATMKEGGSGTTVHVSASNTT